MIEKAMYLIQYAKEMGYKIIFIRHQETQGPFSSADPLSEIIEELLSQE
ncbi:MAG: hypothetical protein LBP53_02985 [Candidatus Peribacteria bacterium]|nr:hypothetical protein [Candidatus Peribacteria bacterium]